MHHHSETVLPASYLFITNLGFLYSIFFKRIISSRVLCTAKLRKIPVICPVEVFIRGAFVA